MQSRTAFQADDAEPAIGRAAKSAAEQTALLRQIEAALESPVSQPPPHH